MADPQCCSVDDDGAEWHSTVERHELHAAEALVRELAAALRRYLDVAHEYGSDLVGFIPDVDGAAVKMAERTAVYIAAYRAANDALARSDVAALLGAAEQEATDG